MLLWHAVMYGVVPHALGDVNVMQNIRRVTSRVVAGMSLYAAWSCPIIPQRMEVVHRSIDSTHSHKATKTHQAYHSCDQPNEGYQKISVTNQVSVLASITTSLCSLSTRRAPYVGSFLVRPGFP
jgi:hypothetical protein